MQSVLAPVSIQAPVAEVMNPIQQVGEGGESFSETFVEVLPDPESASRLDEKAQTDAVTSFSWVAPFPTTAKLSVINGTGPDPDAFCSHVGARDGTASGEHVLDDLTPAASELSKVGGQSASLGARGAPDQADIPEFAQADPERSWHAASGLSDTVRKTLATVTVVFTGETPSADGSADFRVSPVLVGASAGPKTDAATQISPNDPQEILAVTKFHSVSVGTETLARFGTDGAAPLTDLASEEQDSGTSLKMPSVGGSVDPQGLRSVPSLTDRSTPVVGADPQAHPVGLDSLEEPGDGGADKLQEVSGLQRAEVVSADLRVASAVPTPFAAAALPWDRNTAAGSFWERYHSLSTSTVPSEADSDPGMPLMAVASGLQPQMVTVHTVGGESSALVPTPIDPDAVSAPASIDRTVDKPPARTVSPTSTGTPDVPMTEVKGPDIAEWVFLAAEGDLGSASRWSRSGDPHAPALLQHTSIGQPSVPTGGLALSVPQVASQLAGVLIRSKDDTTELALSPEELGRIKVRMQPDSANPDRMLVLISAERPETLDLFRRHAAELADALRSAGYSGADIGFGQGGEQGTFGQGNGSSPQGGGLPLDDLGQVDPAPMPSVGTSLDLRL